MTVEIYLVFVYTTTALSGLLAIACFYKFSSREIPVRLIGLLFTCSFLCSVASSITGYGNVIGLIYVMLEILIIGVIYNHVTAGKYRNQFLLTSIIFTAFAIYNLLFFQKTEINSYTMLVSSFIIIVYSVFYFYLLMRELPNGHLQRLPMFWFNSAFLFFHAGTFFLFAFVEYLVHVLNNNLLTYWFFHNVLFFIQLLIVSVGLWYSFKITPQINNPTIR